mmetsp:Transcript_14887/g.35330  ORF Transcript_14887/g.35330 Transcript_14887/m.35330 type:complete len:218 (+) Transcript_14887:640-1293(+)
MASPAWPPLAGAGSAPRRARRRPPRHAPRRRRQRHLHGGCGEAAETLPTDCARLGWRRWAPSRQNCERRETRSTTSCARLRRGEGNWRRMRAPGSARLAAARWGKSWGCCSARSSTRTTTMTTTMTRTMSRRRVSSLSSPPRSQRTYCAAHGRQAAPSSRAPPGDVTPSGAQAARTRTKSDLKQATRPPTPLGPRCWSVCGGNDNLYTYCTFFWYFF